MRHDVPSRNENDRRRIMSSPTRESFATEVDAELLSAVRTIAQDQGRALESLVDEAFADLVVKLKPRRRQSTPPRRSRAATSAPRACRPNKPRRTTPHPTPQ